MDGDGEERKGKLDSKGTFGIQIMISLSSLFEVKMCHELIL